MDRHRILNLAGALLLILAGVVILALQFVPGWQEWVSAERGWPLIVVGAGAALFVIGLAADIPALGVPACIVGGIGGLLYWQNATGHWETWAYAWALIPGFVGIGVILAALLEGKWRDLGGGAWLIFISLVLYAVFASFLGGVSVLGPYWPALLIVLGIALLVRRLAFAR
jgi:hypothetical protein